MELTLKGLCSPEKCVRDRILEEFTSQNLDETSLIDGKKLFFDILKELKMNSHMFTDQNWFEVHGKVAFIAVLVDKHPSLCTEDPENTVVESFMASTNNWESIVEPRVLNGFVLLGQSLLRCIGKSFYDQILPVWVTFIRQNLNNSKIALVEVLANGLSSMICVYGNSNKKPILDSYILEWIRLLVEHSNRSIKNSGLTLAHSVISNNDFTKTPVAVAEMCIFFKENLVLFLDNYESILRLSACKLITALFKSNLNEESKDMIRPIVLPKMCLNRNFIAEGVRIQAQEAWLALTGSKGKEMMHGLIKETFAYLESQMKSSSPAIREAACRSAEELFTKLDAEILATGVPSEFRSMCLKICEDEMWPVRDAALLLLGSIFVPENLTTEAYEIMLASLLDPVPAVRHSGAVALAKTLNDQHDEKLIALIQTRLESVTKDQVKNSRVYTLNAGLLQSSLFEIPNQRNSDVPVVKDNYDCDVWELAEGAVMLLGEIASKVPSKFPHKLVPSMAKAASHTQYTHHGFLLQSVYMTITKMSNGLDKASFKRNLDLILPLLTLALHCEHGAVNRSMTEALVSIGKKIGRLILQGRLEILRDQNGDPDYDQLLTTLNQIFPTT